MSITFSDVPTTARASQVFVEQEPVSRGVSSPVIPHKILVFGQYDSSKSPTEDTPALVLNKDDAWDKYGRGSHLAYLLETVFKGRGTVPVYAVPLGDHASAAAAEGTLTITGPATADGTINIYVGGHKVSVAVSDEDSAEDITDAIVAAFTADLDVPVDAAEGTSTSVVLTCHWAGESGNQLELEINMGETDSLPAGVGVAVEAIGTTTAGANNPSLDTALDGLGDTWYTEIVCPYLDSTSLSSIDTYGDNRADPGVKRPFAAFVGYTDTTANFITELDSWNSQWITFVPVHGSSTAAMRIAASLASVFAKRQTATPGRPAKNLTLPDVLAGSSNILTYTTRNTIVRAGGSHTYNQVDDTVTIGDLVTTRTETDAGAATEDWQFTIVISNLQFKIYALENIFLANPFDDAVVLADGSGPGPSHGVRPSTVKAYAIALVDDWVERGLSTTRDTIVEGIQAEINGDNAGRIDLLIPDVMVAGLRIVAAKLEWAFVV